MKIIKAIIFRTDSIVIKKLMPVLYLFVFCNLSPITAQILDTDYFYLEPEAFKVVNYERITDRYYKRY